ncbi:pyridoxal phosphate-dependent aminotransferase [Geosporobacter ferrireducens]|uniref:Aminotransferase n=1 Tax=Geosporobacter ferrireducens TaxID=1424294 RepID=A0A1D8GQY3_9FIRM|nr:pyridoxal phosphate-dependent aminotransferase [Geosporobacter ferrireducens]AOT73340.1 aspartate aminotransferase [Geosporobacter ferrireducens]MTI55334.1 pyridoxal phosphate-dependent aminotransferase [Geosporobacter ferrireducens]
MKLSTRIVNMQESPIRKLVPFAENAKKEGKKVYHLNIGQPDIETPENFMNAVRKFDDKVLKYSFSQGMPELVDAMIKYYKKYNMAFEKDEILIMNGGSEALLFALIAIADDGDEVIVPEPFYTNYNGFGSAVGVNVVPITTEASKGFHLPAKEEIIKAINSKSRAILLSNPGNPTGVVYTKKEVQMLADIAKEYNLYVIADEVYREFVYDNLEYTSFGNISEIQDHVIIVDSVSKRFSACGARIGAVLSKNKELMKQILKLCQGRLCCPTLEQIGAVELYNVSDDYFNAVLVEYQKRRDIVFEGLSSIPGVICERPTGAFYVIAKLPVINAEEFVIWMLKDFSVDNETVMLAPAEGFYATPGLGKDEARIAYILNEDDLRKSMNILKIALEKYPQKK